MQTAQVKKSTKRRAPKACERCRVRKVRCDIVHRGHMCTNCTLDDVECIDTPPRRRATEPGSSRRTKKTKKSNATEDSQAEIDDGLLAMSISQLPQLACPPTTTTNLSTGIASPQKPEPAAGTSQIENHFPDFTSGLLKNGDVANQIDVQLPVASVEPIMVTGEQGFSQMNDEILPNFIAPITSGRFQRYFSFLQSQGALDVLQPKIRDAILTSYAHFVHPQLPVVDLHDILEAIATNGKATKISILLFQAIMLSGSAFVETEYIVEAGHESRMTLRKELASRARLLYDFDCETDRLVLVQAITLMTSWQEKGDEVKHLRHWIGIAYNICLFVGLNKDPSSSALTSRKKHLWRRVWWSCYVRDRMLALGLRHSPIIPAEDCETPDLSLEDFDIRPATTDVLSTFHNCSILHDIDQQYRLAEVCIAQQKLCHHLSHVLQARYKTVVPNLGCTSTRTLLSVPKSSKTNTPEIQKCAHDLSDWFRDIPNHLKYRSPPSLHFSPDQDLLIFHCALLNLFYYALVCTLHRPWPPPIVRKLPASEICSQRKSRHAANAILSILKDLQVQEMIHVLPTSGITFLVQAAVTHLCDSSTDINLLRSQSREQLNICLEILDSLIEVHVYAVFSKSFLTSAAAKLYQDPKATESLSNTSENPSRDTSGEIIGSTPNLRSPHMLALGCFPGDDFTLSQEQNNDMDTDIGQDINTDAGSHDGLLDVFDYSLLDLNSDMLFNIETGDLDSILHS